jgi:hypothetical protein
MRVILAQADLFGLGATGYFFPVIFRVMVIVCVIEPLVPVIVSL